MSEFNRVSPVRRFRRLARSVRIYRFVIRGVVSCRLREREVQDRFKRRVDIVEDREYRKRVPLSVDDRYALR